jgi:hypothetical protein
MRSCQGMHAAAIRNESSKLLLKSDGSGRRLLAPPTSCPATAFEVNTKLADLLNHLDLAIFARVAGILVVNAASDV